MHGHVGLNAGLVLAAAGLLVAACSGGGDSSGPQYTQTSAGCASLVNASGLPNSTTAITSATMNAATAASGNTPARPEHCEIQGSMNKRVSSVDGKSYAINFHMRLPTNWNGRFYFMGGGGSNGNLGDALGTLGGGQTVNALSLGYAVISTDSGHDNTINNNTSAGGTAAFGADPQARIDYGYNAYDLVTQLGKAMVALYYGRPPDKSYFVGCSEGGREAMLISQRFPTYFDGLVAGDPGFHLPTMGSSAPAFLIQTLAPLASAAGQFSSTGLPLINKVFTDADIQLVSSTVTAACDGLDGLVDGMSHNLEACTDAVVVPQLTALTCTGAKTPSCLTASQLSALRTVFAGPKNSQGQQLYPSTPWDPGIGGMNGTTFNTNFRANWFGTYTSATNNLSKVSLSATVATMVWLTPPAFIATVPNLDPVFNFALNFNLDKDFSKVFATSGIYTQSAQQFAIADATDLSAFKARGGKMLIYHGNADPNFSVNDTIAYYNAMNTAMGGTASSFVRLFPVPGMNHCSGGPGASNFDMLTPLVAWVEKGVAPASIIGTAPTPAFFGVASRTRPLCPYPQWAHYNGSGDINLASNFTCQ